MFTQITEHEWLKLPWQQRIKLIEVFKIPQSSFTHVSAGEVVTDGHTNKDLSAISISAMQEYVGSKSDNFVELFAATLKKIDPPAPNEERTPAPQDGGGITSGDRSESPAPESKEPVVSTSSGNKQVNRGREAVLPG